MRMSEVELAPYIGRSRDEKHSSVLYKEPIDTSDLRVIATLGNHTIYKTDNNTGRVRFYAVNNDNGLADMTVDGSMHRKGKQQIFKINVVNGRTGSKIKAHKFYRSILLNLPIIFVTDTQSYGGLRIWQELSKYPDIEVFGWLNGKPINVTPLDPDETHADADEVGTDKELVDIFKMKLIAHKRIERRAA